MNNFLSVADAHWFFFLCLIPILGVLVQAALYMRLAIRRMRELNMGGMVKKVVVNITVFSIIPSLPIVIAMAALMVTLGYYLPWLRLSVIGSAMYETMCADMTLKGLGFAGLGVASNFPVSAFVSIVFVMTCVSLSWPICNLVGLRFYDRKLKQAEQKGGFIKRLTAAMFIGLMCYFAVPKFFDFTNVTGIVTSIFAGGSVLLYDWIAKKTKTQVLSDFAFPLAMLTGMAAAIIWTQLGGVR
jgi:hypothetical protein